MFFECSIEMHVTLKGEHDVNNVVKFMENEYKLKNVGFYSYSDGVHYDIVLKGSLRRIVKLTKDCVSGKFEDKYDLY